VQIYELHKAGKTVRELAEQFGLLEKRVWGICTSMRKTSPIEAKKY
jgi:hypothetical protein